MVDTGPVYYPQNIIWTETAIWPLLNNYIPASTLWITLFKCSCSISVVDNLYYRNPMKGLKIPKG